ncbi:hypothetical protein GMRT_12534 [Giardia muris]|uniref:Uncharacterized protein n=1 Tax=Giardia muris TaxID=5742 RepID=A0A4Z1SR91_GIAMU|nr:hypothetical protein GMRT_12534 [Giardia muris]|eukprot:TNJ28402.1 hypothetical protein GMRT_12534 [Giardia muris]
MPSMNSETRTRDLLRPEDLDHDGASAEPSGAEGAKQGGSATADETDLEMANKRIKELGTALEVERTRNAELCKNYAADITNLSSRLALAEASVHGEEGTTGISESLKLSTHLTSHPTQGETVADSAAQFGVAKPYIPSHGGSLVSSVSKAPRRDDLALSYGPTVGSRLLVSTGPAQKPGLVPGSISKSMEPEDAYFPRQRTTLTASQVNPGFMGYLGPDYPVNYSHRYATISGPDVDQPGADALDRVVPGPAPGTPDRTAFTINQATIMNYSTILKFLGRSRSGAISKLNTLAQSMSGNLALSFVPQTPSGRSGDPAAPDTEAIFKKLKLDKVDGAETHLTQPQKDGGPPGRRQALTPGVDRPGVAAKYDALKTPVTAHDLVSSALVDRLEFVRQYLRGEAPNTPQAKQLYESIIREPAFRKAVSIIEASCVEGVLALTAQLELKEQENEALRSQLMELEGLLDSRSARPSVGSATRLDLAPELALSNAGLDGSLSASATRKSGTSRRLGHSTAPNRLAVTFQDEAALDSRSEETYKEEVKRLTDMVNDYGRDNLRLSTHEDELVRENALYKSKVYILEESFAKLSETNRVLQQRLNALPESRGPAPPTADHPSGERLIEEILRRFSEASAVLEGATRDTNGTLDLLSTVKEALQAVRLAQEGIGDGADALERGCKGLDDALRRLASASSQLGTLKDILRQSDHQSPGMSPRRPGASPSSLYAEPLFAQTNA